jgi:enoyl-CoA hydratase
MMAYDYSQYGGVLVKRDEKVLTITLNAPETLNAFTGPMHTSMSRIWDDVNDDPDVHIVVLTGAGRAFSAGGNVIAMQKKIDDPDTWDAGMPEARRIVFRMLECDKPIIARVNGHAVGLGATIALLCDIIIAADDAKIGDPHVNAGLVAGDGGALIWPQLIGFARAKEYLFTGDLMTAAEAHQLLARGGPEYAARLRCSIDLVGHQRGACQLGRRVRRTAAGSPSSSTIGGRLISSWCMAK